MCNCVRKGRMPGMRARHFGTTLHQVTLGGDDMVLSHRIDSETPHCPSEGVDGEMAISSERTTASRRPKRPSLQAPHAGCSPSSLLPRHPPRMTHRYIPDLHRNVAFPDLAEVERDRWHNVFRPLS